MDRRVVSKEEGMAFAASKELQYFESSAVSVDTRASNISTLLTIQKEGQNTDSPFKYLAETFYKLYEEKLEALKSIQ